MTVSNHPAVTAAASAGPAAMVRALLRGTDRAALATRLAATGEPYASLVLLAVDHAARPLLLLSDLADHSRNLKAEPSASLLIDGTAGLAEPLTGARASLQGPIRPVPAAERPPLLDRFVARHPSAALYAGFGDFALYRMAPARAHLVAGFGRIHWVEAEAGLLFDTRGMAALAEAEGDIVAHMNDDHLDAIALYANVLLDRPGAGWRMTGIDPEGCDLRRGGEIARLPFATPVHDAAAARAELVRLVRASRR
ncbi:DUF2470 domain-containing protein [Marivibrio halodurans]|uniref:DUF2470 domain-containing protein n=1 Tax=Marivibrio halodurans TaxID=2039722 RepID=A0A8J7SBQ0_9PROT|nr:DUF2470 domain-containing protein [Marivibrio halodurans]MBP5859087.1 DUF2470 domain-containing protein [Marivibrio halodurans]